jgi:uncharacterized protein YecE (DUF72 family)
MAGMLYLGTSGFSYDQWKHGVFYPEGLKNREMLSYYASRFPSVEINYTFRRFPTPKSLETWKAETPESFRFTLKANQRITHWKRLADVDQDVREFLELGQILGERLGTVLYQCPPTLAYDRSLIESFVGYLPPAPRAAMEFRHASWVEARDLLLEQGVAWCVAETDEKDPGPDDLSWEPFGFLRLRKTEYTVRGTTCSRTSSTRTRARARGWPSGSRRWCTIRWPTSRTGGKPATSRSHPTTPRGDVSRRSPSPLAARAVTLHARSLPGRDGAGARPRPGSTPPRPRGRSGRSP